MQFERHAHTREPHFVTYKKQQVRSPSNCLYRRLKLRKDHHHHRQGLLTLQQLAMKCGTMCQEHFDFAYTAHALTVKTIRGRLLFHL